MMFDWCVIFMLVILGVAATLATIMAGAVTAYIVRDIVKNWNRP